MIVRLSNDAMIAPKISFEIRTEMLELLAGGACFLDAVEDLVFKHKLNDEEKAQLIDYVLEK